MKKVHLNLLAIILIMIPIIGNCQYVKKWTIHEPTNRPIQSSYNINSSNHLKTLELSNGTFITLGSSQKKLSQFGDKILILNYDENGNLNWKYSYTSSFNINEYPYDIVIDPDDNIYIAARKTTYYEEQFEQSIEYSNCLILKLNANGELLWENDVQVNAESIDFCASLLVDDQSNLFTLSRKNGVSILNKYNSQGEEIWELFVNNQEPYALNIDGDNIICVTKNYSYFNPSAVYKINTDGIKQDSLTITKLGRNRPKFDLDKNIYKFQFDGDGEFKIEKIDFNGNSEWTYIKESNLPSNVIADELTDCTFDEQGNVFVTGRYYGEHYGDSLLYSNCDILTTKLDLNGNVIWENIYKHDNTPFSCQIGRVIKRNSEGNIFVAGRQTVEINGDVFASDDIVILKYNQEGERIDSIYFNSDFNKEDIAINMKLVDDDIYVYGYSENLNDSYDMTIVKYEKSTTNTIFPSRDKTTYLYPNPTNGRVNIISKNQYYDIELRDIYGRMISVKKEHNSNQAYDLPYNLNNGIYFLILRNEHEFSKFTLVKHDH